MRFRSTHFRVFLLLPFLAACSGGGGTSAPTPSRVIVSPGSTTVQAVGLTRQYSATVEDSQGRPVTGVAITWSSSAPDVVSIASGGLATALARGVATIRASAEGLTGTATFTVTQVPADVEKVAGDGQTGALSQPLGQTLEVRVTDSEGNPIGGQGVSFGIVAGGGSLTPSSASTNAQGMAMTNWTLGCSDDNPQRATAKAGTMTVEFTASADLSLPAICDTSVPDGRVTFDYETQLVAVGGESASMDWSVVGGTLPPGLDLSQAGVLSGTPTLKGTYAFQAQVQDLSGNTASQAYGLRVCEAPITLAPGGAVTVLPSGPDGCGLFLPAGESGDRYRVGVVWSNSDEDDTTNLPNVTVSATRTFAQAPASQPATVRVVAPANTPADWLGELPGHFREALEREVATEALHNRIRLKERAIMEALGPGLRPLPDRREEAALQRASGLKPTPAPEKISLIANEDVSCSATDVVTALKVGENDQMVIYQDSAQAQVDSLKITADMATRMLDYYRDYGVQVIDEFFGGVSDVDGDGRVLVFVTPVVGDEYAAFVFSLDTVSKDDCAASNEREMVRFNAKTIRGMLSGNYQALGTVVHETVHIVDFYERIQRWVDLGGSDELYDPLWMYEGTAEIGSEMSSRLAWAADGGPPVGAMIRLSDKVITPESYAVLIKMIRVIGHLGSQPNGLVGTPVGADEDHSLYGSGWLFHRWLGDAYGDAATGSLAEGGLFQELNDSGARTGINGISDLLGMTWTELLEEYYAAILLNGTGAPVPERGFTSYDFPDFTDGLLTQQRPGFFPWPVNLIGDTRTQSFTSFLSPGTIGPSGLRAYDLISDGEGLGLEVRVETTRDPIRIVVVRIQ